MQRALIQYRDPKNYALVKEALLREGRSDLIGFGEKFLIPPREPRPAGNRQTKSTLSKQKDRQRPVSDKKKTTAGKRKRQ